MLAPHDASMLLEDRKCIRYHFLIRVNINKGNAVFIRVCNRNFARQHKPIGRKQVFAPLNESINIGVHRVPHEQTDADYDECYHYNPCNHGILPALEGG
jgi:hypothetical protein